MTTGYADMRRVFYFLGCLVFVGVLLYWAQPVLIPLAIALLCTFVLTPLVSFLERHGFPRVLASLTAVLGAAILLAAIGYFLLREANNLASQTPAYKTQIAEKIGRLREATAETWLEPVIDFVNNSTTVDLPLVPVVRSATSTAVEVLVTMVVVLALAFMVLLRREDLRNRVIRLLGADNLVTTTRVFDDASRRISRFLFFQLILNVGFGVVIAVGLYFIGIPYPYLWGALTALLRYVPFLGSWIGALFPLALSLVMPTWTPFFLTAGFYATAELLQATVVEPVVLGHSVGVSGAGQLIAALFWATLWGPVGLVLSTPLTACLCVLGHNFPLLHFLSVLIGDEPAVDRSMAFYQRLLAGDTTEAADLVEKFLKDNPPDQVFDDLLLPALLMANGDHRQGELTKDDRTSIVDATSDILHDLDFAIEQTHSQNSTDAAHKTAGNVLVLDFPFHDDMDRLVIEMLKARTAGATHWSSTTESNKELSEASANDAVSVVLLATFARKYLTRLRTACRRVRAHFPDAKIIVACWSMDSANGVEARMVNAGANAMCTTVSQAAHAIEGEAVADQKTPPLAIEHVA